MSDRDFRMFINESFIKDEYDILQEALIEEGATMDLYNNLKDIKKYHKRKLNEFYDRLAEDDIKEAKKILNEIIEKLESTRNTVKNIDDTAFSDKLGTSAINIVSGLGKIGINVLSNFAGSVASDVVVNKITKSKQNTFAEKNLKNKALIATVFAIPTIITTMKKELDTIQKRKVLIRKEIENGSTKEEAKKKIGSLYKTGIIDYLNSQIRNMKKIKVNLKNEK